MRPGHGIDTGSRGKPKRSAERSGVAGVVTVSGWRSLPCRDCPVMRGQGGRQQTPRLTLRPFSSADLDDLYAYQSRPEVARYLTP